MRAKKSIALWNKAKKIIPGGSQLLSKRAEMFLPGGWPSYYQRAKGIEIIDLDGNVYTDMSTMGLGSGVLGYADKDVDRAVKSAIDGGTATTLNYPAEVELAELLLKLHPWAHKARFARTGGEAMAIAVRIARAATGKDTLAFCGYHGWHDWYLAANLSNRKNLDGQLLPGLKPAGVPRGLSGTAIPFTYNKIHELESLIKKNKNLAAIVMEPLRHQEPENGFLEKVRKLADRTNAVLIFDEITIGFRKNVGGVHLLYGVRPDIAVFAKGMSNGYAMAAIIGKKNVMQAAEDSFISSTYWTEAIGPTAALATIQKMSAKRVPAHLEKVGGKIGRGWNELARKHGLAITVLGPNPLITFIWEYGKKNQSLKTLFTQEMLRRGFLAGASVYVSYAHKEKHVTSYLKAVDEVFGIIKKALENNSIVSFLHGKIAHSGFKRLT